MSYLENINNYRDCLGKKIFNPKRYKKDNILQFENINKNQNCLGKNSY